MISLNLVFGATVKAEWKIATIRDADGFTNVRSGSGSSFGIIAAIKANEFFYCEPSASDWWNVNTIHDKSGFVHKSRIQLIEALPDSSKQAMFFSVFQGQKRLADDYRKKWQSRHKDSLAFRKAVRNAEGHNEEKFAPLLETFTAYFCKTGDTSLLKQLFATMWAYCGSADERPSYAVGDAFVCKTDLTAALLRRLTGEKKAYIAEAIEWGLLNHFDMNEEEKSKNPDFIRLKKILDSVRK